MTITALPTAPQRSDPPATFVARADALVAALATLVSEINADVGMVSALATALPAKAPYTFSATTTSGTAASEIRFNSATIASITRVYINETANSSIAASGFCDLFNVSTSATKGILKVSEQSVTTDYIYFKVTAHSDSGTERELTVVPLNASSTGTHDIGAVAVWVEFWPTGDAANPAAGLAMGNTNITGLRLGVFNSEVSIATTSGTVNIDWTAGAAQKQTEPTGNITYTMTNPAGPCHLQLRVLSDGTSPSVALTWPGGGNPVKWLTAAYTTHPANKNAIIGFWFDGTNYWAQGATEL